MVESDKWRTAYAVVIGVIAALWIALAIMSFLKGKQEKGVVTGQRKGGSGSGSGSATSDLREPMHDSNSGSGRTGKPAGYV